MDKPESVLGLYRKKLMLKVIDLYYPTASTQSGLQPETVMRHQQENQSIPQFAHQQFALHLALSLFFLPNFAVTNAESL